MADVNNIFGGVKSLADSNSNWIGTSKDLINGLTKAIQEHLDNVENVIKDVEKSGCDISDLQNIYSVRLDAYEAIVNLMEKINESLTKEIEIERKIIKRNIKNIKIFFEKS